MSQPQTREIVLVGDMDSQPVALVFADAPCEICGETMTQRDFDAGQGMALTGKTAIYPAHLRHFFTGEPPSPVPEYEANMRRLATAYGDGEGLKK